MIIYITILAMFIMAPINISFNEFDIENFIFLIKVFWIFDMLLLLNKGYYEEGIIV